jgi:hypothetical protein
VAMQRVNRISYWTVEFTDKKTGMVISTGFELSQPEIVVWIQKNLDKLPKGEGKIVKKLLRKG